MWVDPRWRQLALTESRALAGANGMQIGPDGRLYVVSAFGGEIAAIGIDDGELELVSRRAGGISSPDDLTFAANGTMYVSECMDARVSSLRDGVARVVADGLPGANGIASSGERVFVNECRPAGRLFEVYPDGREPRLLADGLELPNGMCAGADGHLYFVMVFSGRVARIPFDGGPVEIVAEGLAAPSSTRWGPDDRVWLSQGGSGEISTIDPRDGTVRTVARARPGIDNLAVTADRRLFVSYYIDGEVLEILGDDEVRVLCPRGLLAPYGIAAGAGGVHVADGMELVGLGPNGELEAVAKYTDPWFPGYLCGLADGAGGLFATVSSGAVCGLDPRAGTSFVLADGLEEPRGIALRPSGEALVAETAAGRITAVGPDGSSAVLLDGLDAPADVAVSADGLAWVSEEGAGRVLGVAADGRVETRVEGLGLPNGVAIDGDELLVLDVADGTISSRPLGGGPLERVATDVPVGSGEPRRRQALGGLPELVPGPLPPFAGLDARGGTVFAGCDATGSVLILGRA